MVYRGSPGQMSNGVAIGILTIENYLPFIPGDTANGTTYDYPVRFQPLKGVTAPRLFKRDPALLETVLDGARQLESTGVRAVTGDCGFLVNYQDDVAAELGIPVFLSSLLQVPFMRLLRPGRPVGVLTANAGALDDAFLGSIGIGGTEDLAVYGLEQAEHFYDVIYNETGVLDTQKLEDEVVSVARKMVREHPDMASILLECSILPPYGAAVREATGLPVFDYITMIDYVFGTVVKKHYTGFM